MKIAQPLHWLVYAKEGGPDVYADVYGAINFYWEIDQQNAKAKQFVAAFRKRFTMPPGDYAAYGYSGLLELARGIELAKSTESDAVAKALRASPTYDHYKGKQWWRACDNKAFQDLFIVRGREPGKTSGEWGVLEVAGKVPANEELDRTCAEKGLA